MNDKVIDLSYTVIGDKRAPPPANDYEKILQEIETPPAIYTEKDVENIIPQLGIASPDSIQNDEIRNLVKFGRRPQDYARLKMLVFDIIKKKSTMRLRKSSPSATITSTSGGGSKGGSRSRGLSGKSLWEKMVIYLNEGARMTDPISQRLEYAKKKYWHYNAFDFTKPLSIYYAQRNLVKAIKDQGQDPGILKSFYKEVDSITFSSGLMNFDAKQDGIFSAFTMVGRYDQEALEKKYDEYIAAKPLQVIRIKQVLRKEFFFFVDNEGRELAWKMIIGSFYEKNELLGDETIKKMREYCISSDNILVEVLKTPEQYYFDEWRKVLYVIDGLEPHQTRWLYAIPQLSRVDGSFVQKILKSKKTFKEAYTAMQKIISLVTYTLASTTNIDFFKVSPTASSTNKCFYDTCFDQLFTDPSGIPKERENIKYLTHIYQIYNLPVFVQNQPLTEPIFKKVQEKFNDIVALKKDIPEKSDDESYFDDVFALFKERGIIEEVPKDLDAKEKNAFIDKIFSKIMYDLISDDDSVLRDYTQKKGFENIEQFEGKEIQSIIERKLEDYLNSTKISPPISKSSSSTTTSAKGTTTSSGSASSSSSVVASSSSSVDSLSKITTTPIDDSTIGSSSRTPPPLLIEDGDSVFLDDDSPPDTPSSSSASLGVGSSKDTTSGHYEGVISATGSINTSSSDDDLVDLLDESSSDE